MRSLALRHTKLFVSALALFSLVTLGCRHGSELDNESDLTPGATAPRSVPIVVFEPPGKPRIAISVEVARTAEQIRVGLMHRNSMPQDHGMLFLMKQERVHSFWMRNTYIPLDMIFVGKDKVVVGVVENTTPLTDDSRSVESPSYYVIEVNAGWTKAHGVGPGTRVHFQHIAE